jgi:hypothetical protein
MPLKPSLLLMPPGGVRLPVPPGRPPPPPTVPGEPNPPFDDPPSPLEGAVRGIEPVPVELAPVVVLDPIGGATVPEAVEPADELEPVEALEPLGLIDVLPVVVLLSPPVVAVCAKTPSERPRKTALIILSPGPEAAVADGHMKARPRIL